MLIKDITRSKSLGALPSGRHNRNHGAKWQAALFALLISCMPPVFAADYAPEVQKNLDEAWRFYNEGKYSSARMQFNEALRLEPNCPDSYNGLGLCAFKEHDMDGSNKCYKTAIELKPDFYNAYYNLANNYYMVSNYTEAINAYLHALKAGEKNGGKVDADLLTSLANVYRDRALTLTGLYKQQDLARAAEYYHRAIKINPNHATAHAMLGRYYMDGSKPALAELELRKAIALRPNYAYAYFVLGQLYSRRREYPSALVSFHNSLKYETVEKYKAETRTAIAALGVPPSVVDHFAQGFEEMNAGNWEAAQSEFESAATTPKIPPLVHTIALNNLGYANARGGKLANAIDIYRQAIQENPHGLPDLYYNLGEAYFQSKRVEEAEITFKQCIVEAKGNHFLAHNALGIILNNRGKLEESLSQNSMALMQSSGSVSVIQFNRGLVLEKLNRKAEAAESYTKYLQASPSGLNAAEAKNRLAKLR